MYLVCMLGTLVCVCVCVCVSKMGIRGGGIEVLDIRQRGKDKGTSSSIASISCSRLYHLYSYAKGTRWNRR